MQLSLTSWSLRACSLEEAAGISNILGIGALDIGYFFAPAIDKAALLADPDRVADEVAGLGVAVPNLYHLFGDTLADRNLADPRHIERNLADFGKVVRFCERAKVPTVFVLPGVVNPGQSRREAFDRSAASLSALVRIAEGSGVTLTIEPHVHSYLESPQLVLDLVERVPGLKLTLDYAHFTCLGWRQDEIDVLAPHAAHVHLRQSKVGELQTKLDKGTINIAAELGTLRDAGYEGRLSIEYTQQDYMNSMNDDILTETIAMRDLVRGWLGAAS